MLSARAFDVEAGLREPSNALHRRATPAEGTRGGDFHPRSQGVGSEDGLLPLEDMPFEGGADFGKDLRKYSLAQGEDGNLFQKAAALVDVKLLLQSLGDQPIVESDGRNFVQPIFHEP